MNIVVDGVDGSGKTTLAKRLAGETGGVYRASITYEEWKGIRDIKRVYTRLGRFLEVLETRSREIGKDSHLTVIDGWINGIVASHVARGGNPEKVREYCREYTDNWIMRPDYVVVLDISDEHEQAYRMEHHPEGGNSLNVAWQGIKREEFLRAVSDGDFGYSYVLIDTADKSEDEVFQEAREKIKIPYSGPSSQSLSGRGLSP